MTIYSALAPVSAAIYAALNVASLTALAPGGVGDDVAQRSVIADANGNDTGYPFVLFEVDETNVGGLGTKPGTGELDEVGLRVHIYSKYEGGSEAQAVLAQVKLLLADTLTVTGMGSWGIFFDTTKNLGDQIVAGVKVKELVAQFRLYVEQGVSGVSGAAAVDGRGANGALYLRDTSVAGLQTSWLDDVAVGKVLHAGGVAALPAYSAVDLAADVTGTLPPANGGSNASSLTNHGVVLGAGSTSFGVTAVGATGTLFIGNTGADPTFSATPTVTSMAFGDGTSILKQDSANRLALRNGVNAQILGVYGTFTDVNNYERLDIGYGVDQGSTWGIVPRKLGTGTLRRIQIGAYNNGQYIDLYGGNANSWTVEGTNSNFHPGVSNNQDLGQTTQLVRTGFFGTSVICKGASGESINTLKQLTELTTVAAAATTDTVIQLPAGAVILAVTVRVTTVIPTATTFSVGDSGNASRFSTANVAVAAGSTDKGTAAGAYYNAGALAVRLTMNGGNPAANTGRVRVTIFYYDVTPATS